MRRLILSLVLVSWCVPALAVDYCADANAVGCWLFREGSGTTVDDSSSYTNTGNFGSSGHPAWSSTVPGSYAQYSASFNGSATSDYINIGNNSSIRNINKPVSIVAWIYTDSISDTGGIVSNGQGSWYFRHKSARLNFLDSNEADILTGSSDLSTGAWFHSAVTLSGDATATIILYKNGSSDGTTTTTRSFTATSTYAAIGCDVQSAGGRLDSEGFDGLMTEVAVFSDVLLSTEINDIKDNGLSPVTASAEGSVFQDFYAEDLTTL